MSKKKRDLAIDGDHIIFNVAYSKTHSDGSELDGEEITDNKLPELAPYIAHFKSIVEDYVQTAEVESICYKWKIGKVRVIIGSKTNFRFKVFPEYKAGRSKRTELFYRLQDWVRDYYKVYEGFEPDDVVSYLVANKNAIGFTTDKDLYNNVVGTWYDGHYMHKCWIYREKEFADRHILIQNIMGDTTDNIQGIFGVAKAKAIKLLDLHGWDWTGVVKAYESHGLTIIDAIQTRRLVDMTQYTKDGLKLWSPAGVKLVHNFGINDVDLPSSDPYYICWKTMLKKCYAPSKIKEARADETSTVCNEWLLFSNFKKWMISQDWQGKNISCQDDKLYSPKTCIFV